MFENILTKESVNFKDLEEIAFKIFKFNSINHKNKKY